MGVNTDEIKNVSGTKRWIVNKSTRNINSSDGTIVSNSTELRTNRGDLANNFSGSDPTISNSFVTNGDGGDDRKSYRPGSIDKVLHVTVNGINTSVVNVET